MTLLNEVIEKIENMGDSQSAYILAHATAAYCNSYYGVSLADVYAYLDNSNKKLVIRLLIASEKEEICWFAQTRVLEWLHEKQYLDNAPRVLDKADEIGG